MGGVPDSAALRTGAYGQPACYFGLRGRTAPRGAAAAPRALWSHQGGTWACRAVLETATRRRNRPRSPNRGEAVHRATRGAGPQWSQGVRGRRRTGPTPPLSLMPGSCWTPCPTGKAPNCAGWPRTRWPTCRYIPDRRQLATTADRSGDRATGPARRTAAAAAAAHHSDRSQGFSSGVRRATRGSSAALAAG